jgi:radical SAM superfamily enzyme YgiQ (UPF0313 family)
MVIGRSAGTPLRILLVKPQARLGLVHALHRFQLLEPIELGYLAATVPEHDVRVLDLRFAWPAELALGRMLRRFAPEVVGISGYSHEASRVKELARMVRTAQPRCRVIVGGHHATVAPEDYEIDAIDAIVRGEGCGPFRQLIDRVAGGAPFDGIPGVRVPGLTDPAAADWPSFPDPATLPAPRRDLWDPRRYFCVWVREDAARFARLFPPTSMVRTSFGCRMKCSFCIVPKLFGGRHQPRPAAAVADEIAALPTDRVYFCDDENFIDEGFAHELAGELERRGIRKRYFAWTRSTTVTRSPDLFARWRALGLDAAFLGFEFPTDDQLRATRKGATVAQNELAHDRLRALGIAVHAAFMLMPESDHADFARLRGYVRAMPPAQCSFTVCTPSPGTDDYQAIRSRIWVDNPHELHDCMHPLTPTRLPLKEFFHHYAQQIRAAGTRNPLRVQQRPVHPADIPRLVHAELAYGRAFARGYRDFPKELWDRAE